MAERRKLAAQSLRQSCCSVLMAAMAAALLCLGPGSATDADPGRTITLIVPFAPDGPIDIISRILSAAFQKSFGRPVIMDNRRTAAGNVGMVTAARVAPDGHTLLLTSTAIAVRSRISPVSWRVSAGNVIAKKLVAQIGIKPERRPCCPAA